nr:hypothetical protein [Azorhizobium doebereinerae]
MALVRQIASAVAAPGANAHLKPPFVWKLVVSLNPPELIKDENIFALQVSRLALRTMAGVLHPTVSAGRNGFVDVIGPVAESGLFRLKIWRVPIAGEQ